jgi:hypothetical protein
VEFIVGMMFVACVCSFCVVNLFNGRVLRCSKIPTVDAFVLRRKKDKRV